MPRNWSTAMGSTALGIGLLALLVCFFGRPATVPLLPQEGGAEPQAASAPVGAKFVERAKAGQVDPVGPDRDPPRTDPASKSTSLAGLVRWADGQPARNVRVQVAGHEGMETLTGPDGSFRIEEAGGLARPLPETLGVHLWPPCWKSGQTCSLALQEKPESSDLVLEPALLPDVIDLEIEVSIDGGLFRMLEEARFHAVEVRISEPRFPKDFFVKQLASVTLPLDRQRIQTTQRIPYQEALDCSLFFRSDPESDPLFPDGPLSQLAEREVLFPKRDTLPTFRFNADQRTAFRGSVHDHLGRPLQEARVWIQTPRADHPGEFNTHPVRVLETGQFFYFGKPESRFGVHAEYNGTTAGVEALSFGKSDFRIVLDLSECTALLFRRGEKPIQNYRIGVNRHLFGRRALPRLPFHEDGMSWLPRSRGTDKEWFMLTWREGNAYFESAFQKPAPAPDGTAIIDLQKFDLRPCGTLDVAFGDQRTYLLHLQRVDPPPPYPPTQRRQITLCLLHVMVSSNEGPEVRLLGIPEGFYRVEIGTGRAGQTLLTLPRHYLSGRNDRLDIPAVLEKP